MMKGTKQSATGGITLIREMQGGCGLLRGSRTHCTPIQVSGGPEGDFPSLSFNFCKVSTMVTEGLLSPLVGESLWLVWLHESLGAAVSALGH